ETEHIKKLLEEDETKSKAEEAEAGVTDSKKKNTIDWLIQHEEDDAEECLEIHEDEEEGGGNDECVEEGENFRYNPCSGTRHRAMVKNVAADMYRAARQQLTSRAGGRKALKADATQGKYKRRGSPSGFSKEELCKITLQHSNDSRSAPNGGPCKGKDNGGERMKIGTEWSYIEENPSLYKDFYLPPRREHMCTSNLEHLETDQSPLNGNDGADKVNHSFLGDVLLAAKYEADFIKNNYNNKQKRKDTIDRKDHATICRAIRYSFADLGDIIRGRDLWDKDDGSKKMEGHLKKIFGKIKQELPKEIQEKYNDDPNYIKLRSDWWTANRRQVWKAMKCALKSDNIQCRMTPDDYIPQRLRWMTEWAEWFCKAQSQEYDKLFMQCAKCMGNGQGCTSGDSDCTPCSNQCNEYRKKIKEWHEQWDKMDMKYLTLYLEVLNTARNGGTHTYSGAVGEKDKPVVAFLQELQEANKSTKRSTDGTNTDPTLTSPYSSAAGYIHQEIGYGGCNVQTQFCEKENGVARNTDGAKENKDKYVFRGKPNDHDDACACKSKTKSAPPVSKKKDVPKGKEGERSGGDTECGMVDKILQGKDENTSIGLCYQKELNGNYPGWDCENNIDTNHTGACMPPRRIKLCLYYLTQLGDKVNEDEFKTAFIRTAAAETFLSWSYYKSKHGNGKDLDEQLNNGEIPPEFLRSMYFTYGDYRDICLNTDISKTVNDVAKAKDKIGKFFSKDGSKSGSGQTPQTWWDQNGEHIWKGMLCGLTHGVTNTEEKTKIKTDYSYKELNKSQNGNASLEDFAKKPQFLRWMIEWGEEFCKKQQEHYMDLVKGCTGCTVSKDGTVSTDDCKTKCEECRTACGKYKGFVQKWQNDWKTQSNKYKTLYAKATNGIGSDSIETKLLQYLKNLKEQNGNSNIYSKAAGYIEKEGYIEDCNVSKQNNFDENNSAGKENEKYAFKHPPNGYDVACKCDQNTKTPDPAKKEDKKDACKIVKELLYNKDGVHYTEACKQKYKGGKEKHTEWNCTNKTKDGEKDGEVCIPPRRQKLYVHDLKELKGENLSQEGLREAFIKCAAIETFFAWHKYKAEKEIEEKEKQQLVANTSEVGKKLQKELESGNIPDEFKRQMFYTLGDYRDILVRGAGGDTKDANNIILNASGSTEEEKEKMKEIQQKIQAHINSGSKPSGQTPQQWWEENGPHIWKGMICALTHKTEKPQEMDDKVKGQLFESDKNTLKTKYQYDQVKLEDTSGAKGNDDIIQTPTLKNFVKRLTYFRWLEEWGEEFCRKRIHKLDIIKKDCRGKNGDKNCSGDGLNCKDTVPNKKDIFKYFDCHSCAKSCRFYKKWIERKKDEFNKQSNAYIKQKENCKKESESDKCTGNDKERCGKLETTCTDAAKFLQKLGPCSKTDNDNGKGKIDFKKTQETFRHAEYCDPCSEFKVDCKNCNGGGTKVNCSRGTINAKDIGNVI
ncbi:hypothetical protein PFTANZ_06244, partial [Plasmodium falciparum Tanzania (2000708)]